MDEGRTPHRRRGLLRVIGPGILVAATGVGAGDLLTAGLGGSAVGVALLWAALVGGVLKWFMTEGVARWQMATGSTLLEGWGRELGAWVQYVFLVYLLVWSLFTCSAIMNACGLAAHSLLPLPLESAWSRGLWGVAQAFICYGLVRRGGFRLFERLMSACIAVMFVTVLFTAVQLRPEPSAVLRGLVPSIPSSGLPWVLGVLGGVGGTVTLLSYGYWIREEGRSGPSGLAACRLDLAVGYVTTALFGCAMIVIGASLRVSRSDGGGNVALAMAMQLEAAIGPAGKWLFLVGFWGAVFSSMLGVWQGIPYLFADFLRIRTGAGPGDAERSLEETNTYRWYLAGITLLPIPLQVMTVKQAQLVYAVLGSFFMPLLAATLLWMNTRHRGALARFRNGWMTNAVLLATLAFFGYVAVRTAMEKLGNAG